MHTNPRKLDLKSAVADSFHPVTWSPLSMSEITLVSSAEDLRLMASYLNNIADQIDKNSDEFEHEHLSESNEQLSDTEIVVFNEAAL